MGRRRHPQVEPCLLPLLGGDWLALLDQAVQVEGRHGLQALRRLRDGRPEVSGITQRELATRMGVTQPAVAKLESGRIKNLELRTLCRWATALGGQLEISVRAGRRRRPKTAAV